MPSVELRPYPTYKESGVEWIGKVPVNWGVSALRHRYSQCLGKMLDSKRNTGSNQLPYLRNTDVQWDRVNVDELPTMEIPRHEYDRYTVQTGDLLVCEGGQVGRCALWSGNLIKCGFQKALHRLRPLNTRHDLARYIYYALSVASNRQAFNDGHLSTIAHLTGEKLRAHLFPFPSFAEQVAIARLLDHADRRIRHYIRAKQKLIALLEEQKQTLIHEAVTGRIDVRTGRPYRDYEESGVEWLGTVPAHWDVWRSKRVFRPRTEVARPGDIQLSATQAYGVIAQADYEEKIGRKVTRILRHLDQRRHVEVDDFVISMRSFQGGLERAWRSGCIRSSYIVLQAATELIVGYFGYLFKSVGYIAALQSTANFIRDGQDLNFGNFCRVDVPFPPVEEQQHIAQAVDRGTDHIDASIERSHRQIGSLREYRTRLMADVVTGKLDVREAAAGLAETDSLGAEDDPADSIDHDADRLETATGS